ncbi:MAG: hypothetical protein KBT00_01655 [Bacteroidales bacterium]|nr:hypothetical protein [Candidatus Cacconaster merdequi]
MNRKYIVAGHLFTISMPEDCTVWKSLTNYAPFEVTDCGDGQLFSLYFGGEACKEVSHEGYEAVYAVELEPEEPSLDLYHSPDKGWLAEMAPFGNMAPIASLQMPDDFSSGVLNVMDLRFARFAIDNSAMLQYAFCSAPLGTLEMHSSVTMKDGRAYMFLARSGTGKSTHSRMWLENIEGAQLLNDDNPIVRIMPDGDIRVFGSPWSGKTPCYKNQSAELGALVRIRRCSENKISRLSAAEAYASVSSSSSGFKPIASMADGLHASIASLALQVPCYVLDCRPDAEAAFTCYSEVCKK